MDGGADPDAWLDVEFRTIFGQSSGDHRMLHASYDSAVSYHSHEWFAGFQERYGLYNQDDQSVSLIVEERIDTGFGATRILACYRSTFILVEYECY